MLLVGLLGAIVVPFGLILAGTNMGFITYANYMESSVKNLAPVIAATPDLADVQIPMGCRYLVLDKNYRVVKTSLEGEDLDSAMEYAISGRANQNPDKQYLFVTRENEYVVLQYYVGSQFTNEWLYEHFPSPEILLYILIAINCMMVCIILTAKFAKIYGCSFPRFLKQQNRLRGKILILKWDTPKSKNLKMYFVLFRYEKQSEIIFRKTMGRRAIAKGTNRGACS